MELIKTHIKDLCVIKPKVYKDSRGFFLETYNKEKYKELGIDAEFVQDNMSKSTYGVIRGLHFQKPPYAQAKLVQVIKGKVLDVAVDLRKNSSTYGEVYSIELSDENKYQFFIPRGFAHGFVVLSDEAIFSYKCDNKYEPKYEGGLMFNDETLNIDWGVKEKDLIISDKDLKNDKFKNFNSPF